jgi:hypothetical protein
VRNIETGLPVYLVSSIQVFGSERGKQAADSVVAELEQNTAGIRDAACH